MKKAKTARLRARYKQAGNLLHYYKRSANLAVATLIEG